MPAAISTVEVQSLPTPRAPAWFTSQNGLFDDARDRFRLGTLTWVQGTGFSMRPFNNRFTPNFAISTLLSDIIASAWVAPAVALANVTGERGYCQSDGVHFPLVSSDLQLSGVCIYVTSSGQLVWAATDMFGNVPLVQQDVYVMPASSFNNAWFRI